MNTPETNAGPNRNDALARVKAVYLSLPEKFKRDLVAYVRRHNPHTFQIWIDRFTERSRVKGVRVGSLVAREAAYGHLLDDVLFAGDTELPTGVFCTYFGLSEYKPNVAFIERMNALGNTTTQSDPDLVEQTLDDLEKLGDDLFPLYRSALRLVEPNWFIRRASGHPNSRQSPAVPSGGDDRALVGEAEAASGHPSDKLTDNALELRTVAAAGVGVPPGAQSDTSSSQELQEPTPAPAWEDIERHTQDLARAHATLRECAREYEAFLDKMKLGYEAGNVAQLQAQLALLAPLLDRKNAAGAAVQGACDLLEQQLRTVEAALAGSREEIQGTELLTALVGAVRAARGSHDPSISTQLREAAASVRLRLRELRALRLTGDISRVRSLAAALGVRGADVSETVLLLDDGSYLDQPERDAKLRLDNEASLLTARIAQANAESRERALTEIENRLRDGRSASISALLPFFREETGVAPERLREVVLKVLARGDYATADALQHWCEVVRILSERGTPVPLAEVLPTLPQLSAMDGGATDASALQVLSAGNVNPVSQEAWQLADVLWRSKRRDWAQAVAAVAWRESGSIRQLARWVLGPDHCPSAAQLSALVTGQSELVAMAIRRWAMKRGLDFEGLDEAPLVAAWLAQHEPSPALHCVEAALESRSESNPVAAACCSAIAVGLGLESCIRQPWIETVKSGGFPHLAAVFKAYQRAGRTEICGRLAQVDAAAAAAGALSNLTRDRNPKGAAAYEVWKAELEPMLGALRKRLGSGAARAAAIEELASIDPERAVRKATAKAGLNEINTKALHTLQEWVAAHRKHLPAATLSVDLPREFFEPAAIAALTDERHSMAATGALGARTALLIDSLMAPRSSVPGAAVETEYPRSRKRVFTSAISNEIEPLRLWRFTLCADETWLEAAGEDLVERLAELGGSLAACQAYVKHRRIGLVEKLLARLSDTERNEIGPALRPSIDEARRDQRAVIETFISAPLEAAQKSAAARSPALGTEVERLIEAGRALLKEAATEDLEVLEQRAMTLADNVTVVSEECARVERGERTEIAARLRLAADALEAGQAVAQPNLVANIVLLAARGIHEQALRLSRTPVNKDDLAKLGTSGAAETGFLTPQQKATVRPQATVLLADLSVLTRSTWDASPIPAGFAALRSVNDIDPASSLDRRAQLIWSARTFHAANDPRWRLFLGAWAIEQTRRRVQEKAYTQAVESARDAVALLGGADSFNDVLLDQAIAFWLAARIEASHVPLARTPMDWDYFSRAAGFRLIDQLVRRFFELRVADLLAECLCDAAELGGGILPRMLSTLSTSDPHLRGLLVREILRGDLATSAGALHVLTDLLEPWMGSEVTGKFQAVLTPLLADDKWRAQLPVVRDFLASLRVPDELIGRFEEGLARRGDERVGVFDDVQRLTGRVVTTCVYSSAADTEQGGEIVAEVSYRAGAGSLRNLRAALTLDHPGLSIDQSQRIQDVGHLRPEDSNELSYRFLVSPNSTGLTPKAKATLLVYGDGDAPLIQRTFTVNVGKDYPFRYALSPYMYGKCLTRLDLIKGREKETREILDKLGGTHGDNFVVIYGMRRIGKSSLLQKLSLDARARKRYVAVHLDFEHLLKSKDTPVTFLENVAEAIRDGIPDRRAKEVETPVGLSETRVYSGFERYLNNIAEALGPSRRLLLLFDEFQMLFEPGVVSKMQDVIKSLRHWIQYLPVSFVAAGTPELKVATVGPEQRLFQLGVPIAVGPLDEVAAKELVRDPAKDLFTVTPRATEAIVQACRRLPNLIQAVCITLFGNVKAAEKTVATYRDVQEAMTQVSRVNEYFTFLLAPIERNPKLRLLVRALADITLDERRGTPAVILDHLRSNGRGDDVYPDALQGGLSDLAELGLVYNYKGEFSLQPPLLAQHVRYRVEYAL